MSSTLDGEKCLSERFTGGKGRNWDLCVDWNAGSTACLNENQTCEKGTSAKGKTLIQVLWLGRMVDSRVKDHPSFLLKFKVHIGIGRRGHFFYPVVLLAFGTLRSCTFIYLSSFWCAEDLSINFSSFWYTQALFIHLSSFWCTQCKNLPLRYFCWWGRLPSAPWLSTVTILAFKTLDSSNLMRINR